MAIHRTESQCIRGISPKVFCLVENCASNQINARQIHSGCTGGITHHKRDNRRTGGKIGTKHTHGSSRSSGIFLPIVCRQSNRSIGIYRRTGRIGKTNQRKSILIIGNQGMTSQLEQAGTRIVRSCGNTGGKGSQSTENIPGLMIGNGYRRAFQISIINIGNRWKRRNIEHLNRVISLAEPGCAGNIADHRCLIGWTAEIGTRERAYRNSMITCQILNGGASTRISISNGNCISRHNRRCQRQGNCFS